MNKADESLVAAVTDRNSATGLLLAGVQKVLELDINDAPAKMEDCIRELITEPSVRFIITTEPLVESFGKDKFEKFRRTLPSHIIIAVIPDRAGSRSDIGEAHIRELVRRAIGKKWTQ